MTSAMRWLVGVSACAVAAGALYLLAVMGAFEFEPHNPYALHDICFARDLPGATDRHVSFAPVRCSDPRRAVGEPAGADMGVLRFEDVDGDGFDEAIVESSRFRCTHSATGCYEALRITLKVCPGCSPQVREWRREFLEDRAVNAR